MTARTQHNGRALCGEIPRARLAKPAAGARDDDDFSFDVIAHKFSPTCRVLRSRPILLVTDLFHPIDGFSVQGFLNGDVRHRRGCRRAMPVLLAGRKPDDIAGSDFLNWTALALHPAAASRND